MSEERNALSRRDWLRTASLGAISLGAYEEALLAQEKPKEVKPKTEDRNKNKEIPRRRLGRTNMMVTVIGTGGAGITDASILNRAIDRFDWR